MVTKERKISLMCLSPLMPFHHYKVQFLEEPHYFEYKKQSSPEELVKQW